MIHSRKYQSGYMLLECLAVMSLLLLLMCILVLTPSWKKDEMIIQASAIEVYEAIKLARHLSVYEETSYSMIISGQQVIVKEQLFGSKPVFEFTLNEKISITFQDDLGITFSRNGTCRYNRVRVNTDQGIHYVIVVGIGSSRVSIHPWNE